MTKLELDKEENQDSIFDEFIKLINEFNSDVRIMNKLTVEELDSFAMLLKSSATGAKIKKIENIDELLSKALSYIEFFLISQSNDNEKIDLHKIVLTLNSNFSE